MYSKWRSIFYKTLPSKCQPHAPPLSFLQKPFESKEEALFRFPCRRNLIRVFLRLFIENSFNVCEQYNAFKCVTSGMKGVAKEAVEVFTDESVKILLSFLYRRRRTWRELGAMCMMEFDRSCDGWRRGRVRKNHRKKCCECNKMASTCR